MNYSIIKTKFMEKTFRYKKGAVVWKTSILGRWLYNFLPSKLITDGDGWFSLKKKIKIKLKA